MTPRITVITLAVADLERSLAFYRDGLGLPTSGITGTKYATARHPSRADHPPEPGRASASVAGLLDPDGMPGTSCVAHFVNGIWLLDEV
jgi:catechol 2,3-dioxygenase-like lactoylglutathione lyase family enzyme